MSSTACIRPGPADEPPTPGPRLVFFEVPDRRGLAQRAAAAAPGVRFASRRDWTEDPGEPRRGLLGGAPGVGLWWWAGDAEAFRAQAEQILLRLIHPLIARGLPFCIGFPFGREVLEPRRLVVGEAALLDVEDVGALLFEAAGEQPRAPSRGPRTGATESPAWRQAPRQRAAALAPPTASLQRPHEGPDAVRLDDAQRAAVRHARGPARVLAPAGSGKTKTLVSRVVELVERGTDPSGILMLAFNREAAEQLEERLAALGIPSTRRLGAPDAAPTPGRRGRIRRAPASGPVAAAGSPGGRAGQAQPDPPPGVHCATFNAFGYRYQREVLQARILLDHDGRSLRTLMARAMETAGVSLRELKPRRGSDPVGAFLHGLTRVRAALEPPEDVQVRIESLGDIPLLDVPFGPTHTQLTRAQIATGVQSFDDQIYFAVADMLTDPGHRAFIQARFDHVLVDEFQDLNGAQLALVDVLSRPHRRLFVVGDDDQLIYGWRQADPRGILEFHRRMPPRPWSATYTLCTNYRCSRAVVETGARLVSNNLVREAKDIRARPGAQDGQVRFFGAPSWRERAAEMCAFLRREKERLGCGWRDLAVLCRYRSQQLLVTLALDAGDVPRAPDLGGTLFTHPAATLLRAYLDLVRAPDELPGAALAGLLNHPNRYLGNRTVDAVGGAARPWTRVKALAAEETPAGPRPLGVLVEQAEALAARFGPAAGIGSAAGFAPAVGPSTDAASTTDAAGPRRDADASCDETSSQDVALSHASEDLVWAVVETFGLDGLWAAEADADAVAGAAGPDGGGALEILDSLLLLAETYPDPATYLRTWDRLRADEEVCAGGIDEAATGDTSQDDRVVVGTIHAAKGREYDSIVIPDYDCDVSRRTAAEVEEERRVVYVGVTRARDAALFTVDTSGGFVHPFLRELVEAPEPAEHESLTAWLSEVERSHDADGAACTAPGGAADARGAALAPLIAARIAEIEVLFPELVPARDVATGAPPAGA